MALTRRNEWHGGEECERNPLLSNYSWAHALNVTNSGQYVRTTNVFVGNKMFLFENMSNMFLCLRNMTATSGIYREYIREVIG